MQNQIVERNDRIKTIYRLCWVGLVFAVIGLIPSIAQPVAYIVMAISGQFKDTSSPMLIFAISIQFVDVVAMFFMLLFYRQVVSKQPTANRAAKLTCFLFLSVLFSLISICLDIPFYTAKNLPLILFILCGFIVIVLIFVFALLLYRKARNHKNRLRALKPFFIIAMCAFAVNIAFSFYSAYVQSPNPLPWYIFTALLQTLSVCVLIYTQIYLPYLALTDEVVYRRFFVRHPFSA